jgi:uncharacterized protein YggE
LESRLSNWKITLKKNRDKNKIMKKTFLILACFLILIMPAWAEEISPHLTVYGTGTVKVTPDEMYWTLRVSNRGAGVEKLAEQHSSIVLSALSFISKTGVAKDDTQTSMMQFGENWIYQNGQKVQDGYLASSRIRFKLIDFAKYQQLWIGLSKIKDMGIQNIEYGYSKRIKARDKARVEALLAAQKKAHSMAKTLKVVLGNPLVIEENESFAEPKRSNMVMASEARFKSGSHDAGGVALGKIEIKTNVRVVYRLTSPN